MIGRNPTETRLNFRGHPLVLFKLFLHWTSIRVASIAAQKNLTLFLSKRRNRKCSTGSLHLRYKIFRCVPWTERPGLLLVRYRQLSDLNFQGVCHGCLFPLRTPHQELSLGLEVMTIGDTPHDQGCGILQDIPFQKDLPPLSHHSGRYLYQGCDRPVVYHRIRFCSSLYRQDQLELRLTS